MHIRVFTPSARAQIRVQAQRHTKAWRTSTSPLEHVRESVPKSNSILSQLFLREHAIRQIVRIDSIDRYVDRKE
jgi:hypothetical protein